jgi:hypothetical protein
MPMKSRSRRKPQGFARRHGLGAGVAAILCLWLILYLRADPQTHWGAFFGNATADWLGTFIIVIATKYFYEIGSDESRSPHPASRNAFVCFLVDHSLTLALIITGAMWIVAYARMDANGRAGQVVGNIVSEWTQVLGLVVMTKYLGETRSKEGR